MPKRRDIASGGLGATPSSTDAGPLTEPPALETSGPNPVTTPLRYRSEIDGLRAIAVLGVVLFHAECGLPGGYTGVDVFFVISGFLITRLIVKAQEKGTFTLREFWERRIRRILPAAITTTTACLAIGALLLLPEDYESLAKSSIAQQALLANVYFDARLDYFAGPANEQPLLHMWSLAVEEQFYMVFPIVLVLIRRIGNSTRAGVILAVLVGSLCFAEWQVRVDSVSAFFLPFSRIWELLMGSVLVFVACPRCFSRKVSDVLSLLGIILIMYGFLYFDRSTRFPGLSALVPCAGAALIIFSNTHCETWIGRILSVRPLAAIGLISYSLYLWHWPLFAFARYLHPGTLPPLTRFFIVLASFALAAASWRFIETPLRRPKAKTVRWRVFVNAACATALIGGVSVGVWRLQGLPERFPAELNELVVESKVQSVRHPAPDMIDRNELPSVGPAITTAGAPEFLVWGDSHAQSLVPLIRDLAEEFGVRGYLATRPRTVPLLDVWRPKMDPLKTSVEWNAAVRRFITRQKIKDVILVSRWAVNTEGRATGIKDSLIADDQTVAMSTEESRRVLDRAIRRTLASLADEDSIRVWLVGQVPLQRENPVKKIVRRKLAEEEDEFYGVDRATHEARQASIRRIFADAVLGRAQVLNPDKYCFAENGLSRVALPSGRLFYADHDHLSPLGARVLLRPLLTPVFEAMTDARDLTASPKLDPESIGESSRP